MTDYMTSKHCKFCIVFCGCCNRVLKKWMTLNNMYWEVRWEGGSCLGTHVRIKDFKIKNK